MPWRQLGRPGNLWESYRAASSLFCSRRVTALGEPHGQAAIAGICFELFSRHSFKGSGKRCVFEFDRLLRLPFCSIGNLSCCLHVAADSIANLDLGDLFGPRALCGIVRNGFFEFVSVGVGEGLALRPSGSVAALPFFPTIGLAVLRDIRIVALSHCCF